MLNFCLTNQQLSLENQTLTLKLSVLTMAAQDCNVQQKIIEEISDLNFQTMTVNSLYGQSSHKISVNEWRGW